MQIGSKKLRLVITLSVLALFLGYFFLNTEKFKPLLHVNVVYLLLIALADFIIIVSNGLFIKFTLEPFDKFISVVESAYVSLISSVGNFFAPVGAGFGFRAVYLNKKHGLPYGEYVSTLSGNYIIVFLVNSFFALAALYVLHDRAGAQYGILTTLFLVIFIMSILLTFIRIPKRLAEKINHKPFKFLKPIVQVIEGWHKIARNRKLLSRLIALILFNLLLSIGIAKLEISALHFSIGAAQLVLFSVLGSLSLFINITPANLGIKEAIYIFSASVIGFTTSQILLIALIDRGVLFITLTILWAIFIRKKDFSQATVIGDNQTPTPR